MTREEEIIKASKRYAAHQQKPFLDGARWADSHVWKRADGKDLPEIDRDVIALTAMNKVVFAHRPNSEGFSARNLTTGEIEHYTPMTFGKGEWNQDDIVWWLDLELPIKEK